MQCTKSRLIKNITSFLLFCLCSVVAWDYETVFRGYRGEEAYSTLHPRSIGRNLVHWGGLGNIPMRKLKKKIEISFPIAFGTEFEMVVLVTPSISLSIRVSFFFSFLTCVYWNKKRFSAICLTSKKFIALLLSIMCSVLRGLLWWETDRKSAVHFKIIYTIAAQCMWSS